MSSTDEKMRKQHKKICEELNIDSPTEERSWKSYLDIKHNYTLDGDPIHWLCCALYVACKLSVTPTVSNQESELFIQGNCVSLTRLLRLCNITLHDFFTKIKLWIEMASLPTDYRRQIEHLIQSFGVSMSVYAKYKIIFEDLFLKGVAEDHKKSKKAKPMPCTPNKLFEFGWTLFICAKADYPARTNELVTSFHMLLACLDLLYANAIADTRRDLINPEFSGLPSNWDTMMDYREKPLCIISELCDEHETSMIDALETKSYAWRQVIKKFFDDKTLLGNGDSFLDILSIVNFDANLGSLNRIYDTYILSCGEFDERIALNSKISENMTLSKIKQTAISDSIRSLTQATPLTGRERLRNTECFSTPITEATKNVNKLRTKLAYCEGKPQDSFIELLKGSSPELIPNITERMLKAKRIFLEKLPNSSDRFILSEGLYYKLLENIIRNEIKQKGHSYGIMIIKELCSQEKFNNALLACSLIIVNYAYNAQLNFLKILNIFDLHAYEFYRIIELVVLYHNDHLTRDIIKYLNRIEEECFESICWESASPIWEKLNELTDIPTGQAVDIPKMVGGDVNGVTPHKFMTNGQNRYDTPVKYNTNTDGQIVVACSSSSTSPAGEAARKQLFKEEENAQERGNVDVGQTVILSTASFNSPIKASQNNSSNVARKTGAGSLSLFLRKFYKLAAIRINDLCTNLQITSSDLLSQIWTIFEYSITKQKNLIKDRHLDQLIMCAIYVFVKIKSLNKNFTEIMKFYRQQPQSASHVYRSVFISNDSTPPTSPRPSNNDAPQNPTVQPGDMAGNSTLHGQQKRGDIIWFYNKIYICAMQDFVSKFSASATKEGLLLSPLPKGYNRKQLQSPRKITEKLYVHTLDKKMDPRESPHSITYLWGSPTKAQDIEKINSITSKRNLRDSDSYNLNIKVPRLTKLNKFISDRQENIKEK